MAEPGKKKDAHVVEIPVMDDGASPAGGAFLEKAAAAGYHPLGEIAGSEGHLLLLKLWQREESRLRRQACALKARMDAARRDAFYLCAAFLALHGLSLALLFAASVPPCPPERSTCAPRTEPNKILGKKIIGTGEEESAVISEMDKKGMSGYQNIVGFEVVPCSVKRDPAAFSKLNMHDSIDPVSCPVELRKSQVIRQQERITFTYDVEFVKSDIRWPSVS